MKILSTINIKDSSFGLYIDCSPLLPRDCRYMEIIIEDNNGIKTSKGIYLPHQLYLHDLVKWTKNKMYMISIVPHYPEQEAIQLMEMD